MSCRKGLHPNVGPGRCAACKKVAKRASDLRRVEVVAERNRRTNLRLSFGITPEQYDRMVEEQGGVCAICGRPPGKYRLPVDHNHETGRVRGLLCTPCNTALGWWETHSDAALQYLSK